MFKKITNIFLLMIVFSVTTGFTVSLHYCCDSLVSMSVNSDVTPCCPVDNGCCNNQTKHIQLEENLSTPLSDTFQKIEIEQILDTKVVISALEININNNYSNITSKLSPSGDLLTNLAKIQSFLL